MTEVLIDPKAAESNFKDRLGRARALVCLALALAFFGGLAWATFAGTGRGITYLLVPMAGLALLAVLLAHRFLVRRWTWVAGSFVVAAIILAFLASDEPSVRRRITLEELSPSFPGAEISSAVLLRLSTPQLRNAGGNRRVFDGMGPNMSIDPNEPTKFTNLLVAQRTAIQTDWEDLAMVRDWWGELAAFDRIGDTSPGRPDDPLPAFQPIRAYIQTASLFAGLQALEGNGDAAFATLQPAIEVSRKLEPSSRTLVRSMISRVGQRSIMDAAIYVLDTTAVSPEAKARFAAALENGSSGEAGARYMIGVESARLEFMLENPVENAGGFFGDPKSWQGRLANAAGPALYNPRRTLNIHMQFSSQLQDLAAQRKFTEMEELTKKFIEGDAAFGVRNLGGSAILQAAVPAYKNVVESYWKTEDKREALIKRLKQGEPPAKPEERRN